MKNFEYKYLNEPKQNKIFNDNIPLFIHGSVGMGKTHLGQAIAWEIKEKNKNAYIIFYKTFGYILPCVICKEHYKNLFGIFHKINYELICREYMIKWVFDLHNIVNNVSGS